MNSQKSIDQSLPKSFIEAIEATIGPANTSIIASDAVTTFAPTVKGSITPGTIALSLVRGLYIPIGRLIFIHIHVVISSISGSPSGDPMSLT